MHVDASAHAREQALWPGQFDARVDLLAGVKLPVAQIHRSTGSRVRELARAGRHILQRSF